MSHLPIIDADFSANEVIKSNPANPPCPKSVMAQQTLITVHYYGFDAEMHRGQIIINEILTTDIVDLFELLQQIRFPVAKVVPEAAPEYKWDERKLVVRGNVTYGFDYRFIADTNKLSAHAEGRAIDINPQQNPYIYYQDGKKIVWPPNAKWDPDKPGTLSKEHEIVKFMESRGWEWGGHWTVGSGRTDYQHFQKPISA